VGGGGWGGFVDLAGLDAGVDEEAGSDAEGDQGAGDSGEDVPLADDGPEDDEEKGEGDGGGDQDDAGETDVGAAAEGAGGGTALGEGELLFGGGWDEAFGDGGEALLAFELAVAGAGPAGDGDDAEDHEAAGDGDDEGAVGGVAEAGEGFEDHGKLLRLRASGACSLFSVGLRLGGGSKVSCAGVKLLEDDEVVRAGNRK
jgi:hypothetical protein